MKVLLALQRQKVSCKGQYEHDAMPESCVAIEAVETAIPSSLAILWHE
jgi:hypothetical protein